MLSLRPLPIVAASILLLVAGAASADLALNITLSETGCPPVTAVVLSSFVTNADGSKPVSRAQAAALACHLKQVLARAASNTTAAGKAAQTTLAAMHLAWAKAFHPMSWQTMPAVAKLNWQANLQTVVAINSKSASLSFWAGLNAYSALTPADFAAAVLMAAPTATTAAVKKAAAVRALRAFFEDVPADPNPSPSTTPAFPAEINWVTAGKVLRPAHLQSACASSWAFATAGALECRLLIDGQTASTVDLSPQHIMDCAARMFNYTTATCKGGSLADAFKFSAAVGVTSDDAYRYRSTFGGADSNALSFQQQCDRPLTGNAAKAGVVRIIGTPAYTLVSPPTKEGLMQALTAQPAAAALTVDASFQHYAGGIWAPNSCAGSSKQALLVVGYSTAQAGQEYFLAKNSLGAGWGEAGYVRLAMGAQDGCGLYAAAYQPAAVKVVVPISPAANGTTATTAVPSIPKPVSNSTVPKLPATPAIPALTNSTVPKLPATPAIPALTNSTVPKLPATPAIPALTNSTIPKLPATPAIPALTNSTIPKLPATPAIPALTNSTIPKLPATPAIPALTNSTVPKLPPPLPFPL